jgi:hypothetical protein
LGLDVLVLRDAARRSIIMSTSTNPVETTERRDNTTTKDALLSRAREAVEAGERSLHDAAEALGLAQEEHSAGQREMAEAVGRSASWVNALLKWRRSGYKDASPFDRPRSRLAAKQSRAAETTSVDADGGIAAPASPVDRKTSTPANTETSTARKASPAEAKGHLKYAIDHWWPLLDDAGRDEIKAYFLDKTRAASSGGET